jgi:hypothetical protein
VVDPFALYYHVLTAPSLDVVRLVRHVLHEETSPESYAQLRASRRLPYYPLVRFIGGLVHGQPVDSTLSPSSPSSPPTIRHTSGESNIVADTLSRLAGDFSFPPAPAAQDNNFVSACSVAVSHPLPPVDLVALAAAQASAQASCPDCQQAGTSSLLWVLKVLMKDAPILVDSSLGVLCPFFPATFCQPIFDAIHGLAHPGIRAVRQFIASRFVWPCPSSQVAAWCQDW